ncbi:MAG TPA: hypothetical protein VFB50_20140 [Chloroflexota bacterium]|nr:hypothetical protein [Chloroflexota bacterium]
MPSQSEANEADTAIDPSAVDVGPTDAEIEAWAQNERDRRESWLRGPTQTQKSDWATRERSRRLAERNLRSAASRWAPPENPLYLMQRYAREAQLACEGAVSLMLSHSVRDVVDQLVQAGRDWEDEYTSRPVRRRIALDSDAGSQGERGSPSAGESPGTASPTS